MADEKSRLDSEMQTNAPIPIQIQDPPITETSLVITAVLVIGAYWVFGLPALIASIFLVLAYLKLQDREYDKAIRYNWIARIIAIIFLVIGIVLTLLVVLFIIIYYVAIVALIAK